MRLADGETIPDLERPRYSCISEAVKFPARRILMEQHKKCDPLARPFEWYRLPLAIKLAFIHLWRKEQDAKNVLISANDISRASTRATLRPQ